ncbi:putative alpha/beta hydrolase [Blattamonas nauphoetae]|uniref:Alpha/beta hydrolase n=1 Tax=Blattamonas nauphoetae TaxID=2049346 RepID=A0ABQ9XQN1_9EUKA|nr:putative alpha/beta hydrolase [Blattamonas nauphoetae]
MTTSQGNVSSESTPTSDPADPHHPLNRHLIKKDVEGALACEQRKHLNRFGFLEDSSSKLNLWYETYGNGPKKVVFVVGFIGHLDDYRHTLVELIRTGMFEVCIFDFPGVGYSEKSRPCFRTSDFAKTVIKLLEHLQWKKTNLFAISLGGMIGLEMFALRPDLFEAAIFGGTTVGPFIPSLSVMWLFIRIFLSKTQEQVKTVSKSFVVSDRYFQTYLERYGMTGSNLYDMPTQHIPFSEDITPPFALIGEALSCTTHRVSKSRLRKAKAICPRVLVLHGTQDNMIPYKNGVIVAKNLDCSLVTFNGSGHLIYIENEDDIARICLQFFVPDAYQAT